MASRQSQLKAGGHINPNEEEITDMEVKTMQVHYIMAFYKLIRVKVYGFLSVASKLNGRVVEFKIQRSWVQI